MPFFALFNPTYLMYMLPAFLLMLVAQWFVRSAYTRWSKVTTRTRISGAEAAARLARAGGLHDIKIEPIQGELSDHYDPRTNTLRLSPNVYRGNSVASLAIAAHEMGHAMQDHEDYLPLRFRAALVPAVNIGSNLGWILLLLGIFLQVTQIAWLGVFAFAGGAIFALATLPVEFDASARAKRLLVSSGLIVGTEEQRGVNAVLNAAALTYIAALITAALQLLYYVSLVMGMGRRRS
jgi:Zn-dependent membrane protease YugP